MSNIKKTVLKVARENPEFARLLKAELSKQAGGTGWPLTSRPLAVGPRRIKKAVIDSGAFTQPFLDSLDFRKVEFEKPKKNPYRNNGTLAEWRVFSKGSFGDMSSDYVWGYVMTEWNVSSKGFTILAEVVVKH